MLTSNTSEVVLNAIKVISDNSAWPREPVCDWIGLSSVLRPRQHSIGYMGDGFYRSKDPTNSIKVLKEKAVKEKANNENN